MATLNKQLMIDNIRNDDRWLHAAILRLASMSNDNTLKFDDAESYNLTYWSGMARTGKNMPQQHLEAAVAIATSDRCVEALWDYVVRSGDKEASK